MSGSTTFAPKTYEFDPPTQTEIVSCLMWDDDFLKSTDGLIKPDYFTNEIEQLFVELALQHFGKYHEAPSKVAWFEHLKDASKRGRLRSDQKVDAVNKLKDTMTATVRSRQWLLDKLEEFAQQQAIANAMVDSIPLLAKGGDPDRFTKVKEYLEKAFDVGLHTNDEDYDYFAKIEERTAERIDIMAGGRPKTGITTGIPELDKLLYHQGWGKQELSALIGGAKSSKSFHLTFFAGMAVKAGFNVLFVTLENSVQIVSTRLDAFFSTVKISQEFTTPNAMEAGVKAAAAAPGMGQIRIRRRPAGTFTPKDLRRLLDEYKVKGLKFDLIVIDYTDIMAPNVVTKDPIANSKSILVDVRQIAADENAALLTAFQTNREGHKSAVVLAEHAAEDFNKIRIADLVLAINRTRDEIAEKKARITFAAARNQDDGKTIFVKQDLDAGMAVSEVESIE